MRHAPFSFAWGMLAVGLIVPPEALAQARHAAPRAAAACSEKSGQRNPEITADVSGGASAGAPESSAGTAQESGRAPGAVQQNESAGAAAAETGFGNVSAAPAGAAECRSQAV